MSEWELLERAARAMFAAVCMPREVGRALLLWAAHDAYMDELRQRAYLASGRADGASRPRLRARATASARRCTPTLA